MTPNDEFWLLVLEGLIAICTIAFSYGFSRHQAKSADERLSAMEEDQKQFITRQEYVAALSDLKEQHRDLKDDVRRIIELLSKRGR